jgi:hypothetical protein
MVEKLGYLIPHFLVLMAAFQYWDKTKKC